jgi:rubrerythrin
MWEVAAAEKSTWEAAKNKKGGCMMAIVFSAREIAEAAVEKEKKRRDFFANVAQLSTNQEMKELFRFLTEEEENHVAAFAKLRDQLPAGAQSGEYDADMQAYMDSVIDDRLYSDVDSKEAVQKAIAAKEVLRLAIGFEKDAILYFSEFLPYVNEKDRKVVEGLIEEEKGHMRMLSALRKKMAE